MSSGAQHVIGPGGNDWTSIQSAVDAHAVVAITDPHGKITYANDRFCQISQYSAQELIGQNYRIVKSGHHPSAFFAEMWETIASGGTWQGEICNRAKDGSLFWVAATIVPSINSAGRITQYVTIRTDITQRKKAEAALREALGALTDLKSALDAHASVAVTGQAGKILSVNDGFCRLSKYAQHELIGQTHSLVRSDHHSPEFFAAMWSTIAGGKIWKGEICNRAKDGSLYWVDSTIVPILGADGVPAQYVAIRADITERKQAQAALAASEERLRAVFDNEPHCVKIIGPNGNLRYMNPAGLRMIEADNLLPLIGRPVLELVHAEDRDDFIAFRASVAQGQAKTFCFRILGLGGAVRWVESHAVPLKTTDGAADSMLSVTMDITERRASQAALEALNHELDYRVSVRTAQLEAANRELEAFSYSVSHDLRSPLIAIDGFSHILLESAEEKLTERECHALRRIRAGVSNMSELIDALLNLAQVSRTVIRWQPVDLSALAQKVVSDLQEAQPERLVEVVLAPDLQAVGDPDLLRQVLFNLIGNAWKFTAQQASARIEWGCVREDDGQPTFFVRDSGAGFDMAHSYKLFTAFNRLHGQSEFPGTGIGLATVSRILARHNGTIWADAAIGKGAVFYFNLGQPDRL